MQARIAQVDRQQFLLTRRATVLFGIATVLSLVAVILLHVDLTSDTFSFLNRRELNFIGFTSAVGYAALFAGMGDFWLNCDVSSKVNRTVWFAILLLGCAYGSQIAYYAIVYLPAVTTRLRNPGGGETGLPPERDRGRRRGIGRFGWVLLVGWVLFFLTYWAHILYRVRVHELLYPYIKVILVWPVVMFAATVGYGIVRAFRIGMRRPSDS
jgi:hypothetical protein